MKYLKTYEYKNSKPKIGDYVIINPYINNTIEIYHWILNHIGKIIDIENDLGDRAMYIVKYENIPNEWKGYFSYSDEKNIRKINRFGIKHFSPDKEDLETILLSNKFNI